MHGGSSTIAEDKAIEAYAVAVSAFQKGNLPRAIKFWKKVVNNKAVKEKIKAKAYLGMGFAHSKSDKFKDALSSFKLALSKFQGLNDKKSQVETLGIIGGLYFRNNYIKDALTTYQTGLYLAKQIKNREMEADILGDIGSVLDFLDKYDDAIDFYSRSLKIYRKMPKQKGRRGEARALSDLGLVHYHADKLSEARSLLEKASRLMKKHNDKRGEANVNRTLGDIYVELGQTDIAEKHYKRAQKYFQIHKMLIGLLNIEVGFGKILFNREEYIKAKDKFENALEIATKYKHLKLTATALLFLSRIYEKLGNIKEAQNNRIKANKILKDLGIQIEKET
ncbi:MAG: tetratricopeptide repeat protein [Candidatus Helarchaeota archaeon]|nr:tetratricopeptide repeat protein [Candidatus Helarchaeota archaeon]